jgi:hypothetical protein
MVARSATMQAAAMEVSTADWWADVKVAARAVATAVKWADKKVVGTA